MKHPQTFPNLGTVGGTSGHFKGLLFIGCQPNSSTLEDQAARLFRSGFIASFMSCLAKVSMRLNGSSHIESNKKNLPEGSRTGWLMFRVYLDPSSLLLEFEVL